ncbi:MAG: transglycosylase domain-containing protein, partial [Ktedonobacteraceae bacterium]
MVVSDKAASAAIQTQQDEVPELDAIDLPLESIYDYQQIKRQESAISWRRPRRRSIQYKYIHGRRKRAQAVMLRKKRIRTTLLSIFCCLLVTLISSGLGETFSYYQSLLPRVQNLASKQFDQSTHIYDRNGNLLYTLYNPKEGRGTPISYTQIPGVLQDAQIAAEDKTFWTNSGVDPTATVRSAMIDLVSKQAETGASTLTQQIIKNLSGDKNVNGQRKLNEALLAIGLTQEYPKWKILEMYFNISPYGAQELGVEAAVQDYFGLQPECDTHFHCTPATAFLDRDLSHCSLPHRVSSCQSDPLLALARASLLAGIP